MKQWLFKRSNGILRIFECGEEIQESHHFQSLHGKFGRPQKTNRATALFGGGEMAHQHADVIVTPINFATEALAKAAVEIAEAAEAAGLDVLLDDRDERPGVKFKDADLIGAPWRVTVGKKVEQGLVEVVERRSKEKLDVAVGDAVGFIGARR